MVDGLVPGLLFFTLLIVWSGYLTKQASRRVRSAHGAVAKLRHALPALIAWCWPLLIAADGTAQNMSAELTWLLPFAAPLIGTFLAESDRSPTAEG